MVRYVLISVLALFIISCKQDKRPILGDTEWQREMNATFKDASRSPLKDKDRKDFKGLDFFKFDSLYVVEATLKRTPNSKWFNMKTTTNRVSKERIYAVAEFSLKDKQYTLNIYQGEDTMKEEGLEDYLFLPFLDDTNGDGSYGGGRYIDLRIPEGDTIIIDFNKSYNPYCVYDERFSCPIVPRENYIDTRIEAGIKNFEKN